MELPSNPIASRLRSRKTHCIAVLFPDLTSPGTAVCVEGVESVLKKKGYDLLLCLTYRELLQEQGLIQGYSSRADGMILHQACLQHDLKIPARLKVVSFWGSPPQAVTREMTAPMIQPSFEVGVQAAQALLDLIEHRSGRSKNSTWFLPGTDGVHLPSGD